MEILEPQNYGEYEAFVSSHPQGGFTQSTAWRKVKNSWGWEAVVSRDKAGAIVGAAAAKARQDAGRQDKSS